MMPLDSQWSAPVRRVVTFLSLAVVLVLVGVACGGGTKQQTAQRPSTTATVAIVSPTGGQVVTGTTLHVVLQLNGGTIILTSTATPTSGNVGHVHLIDNGSIISMAFGTQQDISLTPGTHILEAEFVASDPPALQSEGDRLGPFHGAVRVATANPARALLVATPLAIGLGLLALAARVPSTWAVFVTAGVGVVGLLAPIDGPRPAQTRVTHPASVVNWLTAVALGLAAMLIAARLPALLGLRPHGAGRLVVRVAPAAVAASVVAAVAEEIFFRRLVYGWLVTTWGAAVAICGSALAFAVIHVPVYGFAVLPIDTAAGLLLGWQRWMTGGWSASGLTHVAANLIAEGVMP